MPTKQEKQTIKDWIRAVREAPCADCAGEWTPEVMHFHHCDSSEKTAGVARMAQGGYTRAEIWEEINKCILLCANCHITRHVEAKERNAAG